MPSSRLPTSPVAFRRQVERLLRQGHSDVAATMEITWSRCERIHLHNGAPAIAGTVQVSAPGYRTRTMNAILDAQGLSIR